MVNEEEEAPLSGLPNGSDDCRRAFSAAVRRAVLFLRMTRWPSRVMASGSPVVVARRLRISFLPCSISSRSSSSSFRAASRRRRACSFSKAWRASREADSWVWREALREMEEAFWAAWEARAASVAGRSTRLRRLKVRFSTSSR